MNKKLFCDISEEHEKAFMLIKGALGAKTNGEALERIIERTMPGIRKEVSGTRKAV